MTVERIDLIWLLPELSLSISLEVVDQQTTHMKSPDSRMALLAIEAEINVFIFQPHYCQLCKGMIRLNTGNEVYEDCTALFDKSRRVNSAQAPRLATNAH